ncbi:2S albumin seed storage protein [Striga asiatica]|uniref:2S albumin seed storage protein n=1 Tax=Striga asiatica TaxID=4170 RepID=A0A5A7RCA5_STRAF|nr:2S albumin seed storage protein [Striga asiatica]
MTIKMITLLLALLAAAVVAAAFEYEASNPRQQHPPCQVQMHGRQFQGCQTYLCQGRGGGPQSSEINPQPEEEEEKSLRECCRQLAEVAEECRCEAVKRAVRQLQQKEGQRAGQEQIYEKATDLPRACHVEPPECRLGPRSRRSEV